jgi:hypothetical protein
LRRTTIPQRSGPLDGTHIVEEWLALGLPFETTGISPGFGRRSKLAKKHDADFRNKSDRVQQQPDDEPELEVGRSHPFSARSRVVIALLHKFIVV